MTPCKVNTAALMKMKTDVAANILMK